MTTNQTGECYSILLKVERKISLNVGRLGRFSFPQGYYVYTGRAKGRAVARIQRHMRKEKRLRWHIDYLTGSLMPFEIWYQINPKKNECAFLHFLHNELKGKLPIIGFGSSDCKMKCGSHLVAFQLTENLNQLYFKLKKKFTDINRVSV